MAILFCGIVMSHYTHFNLSPVTQITVQQTFRTLAFLAETAVFAYLGLAIFSFSHDVRPAFVVWTIVSKMKLIVMIVCVCFDGFLAIRCSEEQAQNRAKVTDGWAMGRGSTIIQQNYSSTLQQYSRPYNNLKHLKKKDRT